MSKIVPYPLYQTLCGKLSKKEPTITQKKALSESIDNLYEEQKKVFIRLILEHARINDCLDTTTIPYVIPYGGEEKDGIIVFDMENELFPTELKWILIKFFRVCIGQTS
jgi:hypothetical protein